MRPRTHITHEEAERLLIEHLAGIVSVKRDRCEGIRTAKHISDHDNAMASGIVSRIDYDETTKKYVVNGKDILRNDAPAGPDVTVWAARFIEKHGGEVLRELLARHFLRAENDGLLGSISHERPDRSPSLPESSRPGLQTIA